MEDLDIVYDEVNNIYTVADVCVVCDLYAIKCGVLSHSFYLPLK